ncbi:UNVERIFIED_CONTAM: hypothetical protein FKN15_069778 [Acipenser sinensis]
MVNIPFFVSANPSTTCYDSASRSVPDGSSGTAHAAAAFCCTSYENRLLASTRTELNAALGMYGSPYAAASQNYANYFPYSTDPSTLYSTLNPQYDIKDGAGSLHAGIAQSAACYHYDQSLGQYQYDRDPGSALIIRYMEQNEGNLGQAEISMPDDREPQCSSDTLECRGSTPMPGNARYDTLHPEANTPGTSMQRIPIQYNLHHSE